ncbi:hypothetical protein OAP14_02260 [Aliiglaciecola sp.]|jgi:hypothetical protein|nr:hypothetical protein [Aliiglaciecola sp.]
MQNPGSDKKVGDKPKTVETEKKASPTSDLPKQEEKTEKDKN